MQAPWRPLPETSIMRRCIGGGGEFGLDRGHLGHGAK